MDNNSNNGSNFRIKRMEETLLRLELNYPTFHKDRINQLKQSINKFKTKRNGRKNRITTNCKD